MLDQILQARREKLDLAVLLNISDEAIIDRLANRRICSSCHKSYHLKHNPPMKTGVCDVCGAPLYHRSDDNPETIKTRLHVFHSQTEPIVEAYRKRDILVEVNSDAEVDEVYQNIEQVVERFYQLSPALHH
jgi:adenylate kinase